ncbi:phosphoribosylpyrophosphate synthetase [Emticicia agri]|uniref:Phosphoribosylpyrophosphate synthetase n=1 Tax=Emticicia agri TaxID=2492393 RepID=A0A4Q5M002_9BACT|nr:phosphoribosylpyrophosphate synthetase [Emticicia agri]RYU95103.1 phosphoribosylpyrophosphate synthetase [Emticicia agri]
MTTYDTSADAINALVGKGYDHNFNLKDEVLYCHTNHTSLQPDEFQIDEVYRFEGETNPDDEVIVYAISSTSENIKGVLINAYGVYAESVSAQLVEKLKIIR